jgi:hypothetical protein
MTRTRQCGWFEILPTVLAQTGKVKNHGERGRINGTHNTTASPGSTFILCCLG